MTTDHDVMRRYAWQLYLRRLDAARDVEQRCIDLDGVPPRWVDDRDQMQRDAWREARQFFHAGLDDNDAACCGECPTYNPDYGNDTVCAAAHHREPVVCTRNAGHAGPHEACGVDPDEHPIMRWSNES